MALVWSVLAIIAARKFYSSYGTGVVIGLLVFSHWIVDFIAKPMRYSFPDDSGLPILFGGSPTVGLGLWSTQAGQNIGEYGTLIIGIVIYIYTRVRARKSGGI